MKQYFVRHGQSEFNAGLTTAYNSEITAKGIEQAVRAAMTLKEEITDNYVGYTSPYIRCLQTALAIQYRTDITFTVKTEIGETPEEIHNGTQCFVHKNILYNDFDWSLFPDWMYNYSNESFETYDKRLNSFVEEIKDKNCIVVSHITPIIHMIKKLCKTEEPMTIKNCSISLVEDNKLIYVGKET